MTPDEIQRLALWLVRGIVAVVIIVLLFYFGSKGVDAIQAPAKLDAAIGTNHALAASVGEQNKAIDGLKSAGDARKAKSEAATKTAGEAELAAAQRIQASKAPGATPLERAANRINAEFAQ